MNNLPIIPFDKIDPKAKLTSEQVAKYLDDQTSCPFCNSESLSLVDSKSVWTKQYATRVNYKELIHCHHCGKRFTVIYQAVKVKGENSFKRNV